jgi:hypothetical protein
VPKGAFLPCPRPRKSALRMRPCSAARLQQRAKPGHRKAARVRLARHHDALLLLAAAACRGALVRLKAGQRLAQGAQVDQRRGGGAAVRAAERHVGQGQAPCEFDGALERNVVAKHDGAAAGLAAQHPHHAGGRNAAGAPAALCQLVEEELEVERPQRHAGEHRHARQRQRLWRSRGVGLSLRKLPSPSTHQLRVRRQDGMLCGAEVQGLWRLEGWRRRCLGLRHAQRCLWLDALQAPGEFESVRSSNHAPVAWPARAAAGGRRHGGLGPPRPLAALKAAQRALVRGGLAGPPAAPSRRRRAGPALPPRSRRQPRPPGAAPVAWR